MILVIIVVVVVICLIIKNSDKSNPQNIEQANQLVQMCRLGSKVGTLLVDQSAKTYLENTSYDGISNNAIYMHLICDTSRVDAEYVKNVLANYQIHIGDPKYRAIYVDSFCSLMEWNQSVFEAANSLQINLESFLDNLKFVNRYLVSSMIVYAGQDASEIIKTYNKMSK